MTTDFIVGFPGETEADFQASLDLLERARFENAFTFLFSPRPHTAAARRVGTEPAWAEVPREVAVARLERLQAAQRRITEERLEAEVGRLVEVLCEGTSDDPERRYGRTSQNRLVHFAADEASAPLGALLQVRVVRAGRPGPGRRPPRPVGGGGAVSGPAAAGRPGPDRRLGWLLPAALYAGLIWFLSAQSNPLPGLTGAVWDKAHPRRRVRRPGLPAGARAGAGLPAAAAGRSSPGRPAWPRSTVRSDELHQAFVPNRSSEVADWVADTTGALAAAALAALALRRWRARASIHR